MPGMFGAVGVDTEAVRVLTDGFTAVWPDATVCRSGMDLVGGHTFLGTPVLQNPRSVVAVDGERAAYSELDSLASTAVQGVEFDSVANVAVLDREDHGIQLTADSTGTFPLYFCRHKDGLLFSSLVRPLARAIRAPRNDLAILEFLRNGYIVGGKTPFKGIFRLLPGQTATFVRGRLEIRERSRAWAGVEAMSGRDAVDVAWARLQQATTSALSAASAPVIMMSAGWDSRTLLASALDAGLQPRGYSHGDIDSRELDLVRRLTSGEGVDCRLEPIDDRVLEMDALEHGFARTENIVFPHWHRAGRILQDQADVVAAGVFGEILGGHYGPAMLVGSAAKMALITGSLAGVDASALVRRQTRSAAEYLHVPPLPRHWYLRESYERAIEEPQARMNADIDQALARLQARGIAGDAARVEAFISEHRGTQYINMQLLSCRAHLDVALPFARRNMFEFATRVPLSAKVHNALNRRMLKRYHPELLRFPMAATLIAARHPILAQELSRAVRKVYEDRRLAAFTRNPQRRQRPRLGWVDFEFLRSSQRLAVLADSLRSEIWDKARIAKQVMRLQNGGGFATHPFYDQLMKVVTVDRLIS